MVEWFSCWLVSAKRYRKALLNQRDTQKRNVELNKYILQLQIEARRVNKAFNDERGQKKREYAASLTDAANTLNDERLRFIGEKSDKDVEIDQLKLDIRLLNSDLAVADRDKENLIGSNELARAQNEAMQAGCSAQKTKYLTEESRPPIGDLL